MPYFLEFEDGRQRWSLAGHEEVYLIGRAEDCDIRLESRKVSRRHCCIAQVNDYLAVRDLASTNGIRINGQEKFEGRLYNGDILTVGPYRLRVIWQPERVEKRPPTPVAPVTAPSAPRVASAPVSPLPTVPAPPPEAPEIRHSAPKDKTPNRAKPGSLLEDSNLFKLLESEDPLTGGKR
ncbi:MAG: FHA domain-containing protein [Gemmatales bacterium]|nr:FHA domain-containing protein [Gemmatales bacterium]MCS7158961.1 FHA domain-containing protein [Gemmatales bacterium]MDW8174161.1 FHA domain-containing protein [Gemmatales bacterium]MDW8223670.1 FHA domain-containing protein [Gemmatales bacterium]